MDPTAILVKTQRGQDEIRTRAIGLPQRSRTMLVMVDGRASAGELIGRVPTMPDADTVLDTLVREGFAEVQSAHAAGRAAPRQIAVGAAATFGMESPYDDVLVAPSLPPAEEAWPEPGVRQAVMDLCQYLDRELGPQATPVTVRIESALDRAEFAQAVRRGIHLLQQIAGPGKANQFQARAQVILDTYFWRS